ncbi:MAG: thymidine phosphorylase [Trueperaceae bacterium]|nr:thymidine phosphorylase [Trueperaceae bacterium]
MRTVDLIAHKRNGGTHDRAGLEHLLGGYLRGELPDYQISAWLMAVCFRGMTPQETTDLTELMAASGDTLDLSALPHTVDKHSTGGVGDKTSLVLAPLLAACGATVAKMSGRGLGHTGGTVDKLESIPGFRSSLGEADFIRQAQEVGVVISGQSKDLAPADGLLYALRDATATVESLPLIASSIMSKKLASGAQSIVLDVKVGSGAFMDTVEAARELATTMIDIGQRAGRSMRAVLSDMEEPLGFAVGNALEVHEAVACLKNEGPSDLRELCLVLAQSLLAASGLDATRERVEGVLASGAAYERFERWIAAQGGDVATIERLELAPDYHLVYPPANGYLAALDARRIGDVVKALGGGRQVKGEAIDTGVGIVLHAKIGDEVATGEPLMSVYHRNEKGLAEGLEHLEAAVTVRDDRPLPPALVIDTLP